MSAARQLSISSVVVEVPKTPEEQIAEQDRQILLRVEIMAACRAVVRDLGGNDAAAALLDKTWGRDDVGRGVSGSTFKSCVNDTGNYFRLEWIFELANHSETIRNLLHDAADGRGAKPEGEELRDLQEIVRKKLPEDAEAMIRKAKHKRRAR